MNVNRSTLSGYNYTKKQQEQANDEKEALPFYESLIGP
jgi:hypothetical protein